jgi:DNA-binding GntR family transcriptional regulator
MANGSSALRADASGQPLASSVEAELEAMIASGELGPGQHINELALAKRLGVSRGLVREATRALERMGLVAVILNRGAFVRNLPLDEAKAIYELNGLLLGYACGRLASAVTAALQAVELQGFVADMGEAARDGRKDAFFDSNVRFYMRQMAMAGKAPAEAVYLAHTRKLILLRRRSFEEVPHMVEANAEHRAMVEAILAGDAERPRQLGQRHGRSGRARLLAGIAYRGA